MKTCCFPGGSRAWCGVLHGVVGQVWFRLDKVRFSSGHGIDRLTRKEAEEAAGMQVLCLKKVSFRSSFLFHSPSMMRIDYNEGRDIWTKTLLA